MRKTLKLCMKDGTQPEVVVVRQSSVRGIKLYVHRLYKSTVPHQWTCSQEDGIAVAHADTRQHALEDAKIKLLAHTQEEYERSRDRNLLEAMSSRHSKGATG